MNYFLRNLPDPLKELDRAEEGDEGIGREWSEVVARASEARFGTGEQWQWEEEEEEGEEGQEGQETDTMAAHNGAKDDNGKEEKEHDDESDHLLLDSVLDKLQLVATPSALGAHALAQAIVYRIGRVLKKRRQRWKKRERPLGPEHIQDPGPSSTPGAADLVRICLDPVFSVLLELNRREPELCAHSLQSLLQILQSMHFQSLQEQCRDAVGRMHELLRELRREGNAPVSAAANACMMSLAVASGHPDLLLSTVFALLCESKRHVPFNQLSADSNPLPRNFHHLALSVQNNILKVPPPRSSTSRQCSIWISEPLERRPMVCEFEVIYTGRALLEEETEDERGADSEHLHPGCLASDGAFVYLLTVYGFFKLGTGLGETRAGELLVCNDAVRYIPGSGHSGPGSCLFISNGSLYLRHRHSSRLCVLDTETLREIGEILLPAELATGQGQLFADGRQFWHATLDEQLHLVCTPLDDSFAPAGRGGEEGSGALNDRNRAETAGNVRLVECEFCAFGELEDMHNQLLRSIPAKLRGTTADLQLAPGAGFLLSRCGRVFYAGPTSASGFGLPTPAPSPLCWTRLQLSEPIVAMALEPQSRTLILRSGAGNLWIVSAQRGRGAGGKSPKRRGEHAAPIAGGGARKLKVPNKKKCVSMSIVSVGGGCLALAMENGRAFLFGRHVLNSGGEQRGGGRYGVPQLQPASCSSPSLHAASAQPVPGLEHCQVAQLALGKTHLVAVARSGALIATGLNNQNQCGRRPAAEEQGPEMPPPAPPPLPSSSASANISAAVSSSQHSATSGASSSSGGPPFCSPSQHLFLTDELASRCARCGLCSVRGAACYFGTSAPTRGGTLCPCARHGRGCCVRCGMCRECAEAADGPKQPQLRGAPGAMASPRAVRIQQQQQQQGKRGTPPLAEAEEPEEEVDPRRRKPDEAESGKEPGRKGGTGQGTASTRIMGPERVVLQQQPNIKVASASVGNFHTVVLSADNQVYTFGANTHGQLGTGDTAPRVGTHKLALPANVRIVQAIAGANHTVLRTIDGRLITFGAHKAGQLGRKRMATPTESPARQWFAEPGFVPGFGQAYGRLASWVGAQADRTLVQTQRLLISRAELASARITASGEVMMMVPGEGVASGGGNRRGERSRGGGYLMVGRKGPVGIRFRQRQWQKRSSGDEDGPRELAKCSFCLDPRYSNLLWAYDPCRMCVFALSSAPPPSTSSAMDPPFLREHRRMILRSTERMIPSAADDDESGTGGGQQEDDQDDDDPSASASESSPVRFSDVQLGIFLLSTVHSLYLIAHARPNWEEVISEENNGEEEEKETDDGRVGMIGSEGSGRPCRVVSRFDTFGGGWGYSAHCVEAIQFRCSRDILFCGVGLFGGRGEYNARMKLMRGGCGEAEDEAEHAEAEPEEADEEQLLAETDEVLYECAARETAVLQLEMPIPVRRDRWHVVWVQIQGPSSDCGAGGHNVVRVECERPDEGDESGTIIEFQFRDHPLSNNGTNVHVGQIPELYFSLTDSSVSDPNSRSHPVPGSGSVRSPRPVPSLTRLLASLRPSTLRPLLYLSAWAFRGALRPSGAPGELWDCDSLWRQERAALVAVLCLRLLRLFVHKLPEAKIGRELVEMYGMLKGILRQRTVSGGEQDRVGIFVLAEAVLAFTDCAHKFTPSPALLRTRLLDHQFEHQQIFGTTGAKSWWLLALLGAARKMEDEDLLQIVGMAEGDKEGKKRKIGEEMWREEGQNERQMGGGDKCSAPEGMVQFLYEMAFVESDEEEEEEEPDEEDGREEEGQNYGEIGGRRQSGRGRKGRGEDKHGKMDKCPPPPRALVGSATRHLLTSLARQLMLRSVPRLRPPRPLSPALLQSPSRFRHISALPQWDVGGGGANWDAIAFRVDADSIRLAGAGIFSGSANGGAQGGPDQFELEFLLSQDGATSEEEEWLLVERVAGPLDSFPTQIVHLAKCHPLKSGTCYALRVRFVGVVGQTLYGEGGLFSVRLHGQVHLHFLPCAMSRNGTTVARGQFPFLLYTVEEEDKKEGRREDEEDEDGQRTHEAEEQLFELILRQLVQRLSRRMVHRTGAKERQAGPALFRPGEQALCTELLGRANVWAEARPRRALQLVAILDEAIPILEHVNTMDSGAGKGIIGRECCPSTSGQEEESDDGSSTASCSRMPPPAAGPSSIPAPHPPSSGSSSSSSSSHPHHSSPSSSAFPLDSPHPGQPHLALHHFRFPGAAFLSVRFENNSQSDNGSPHPPGDTVWVYVKRHGLRGSPPLFPVARFWAGNRQWPLGGGTLLVPGDSLWVLIESGGGGGSPRQGGEPSGQPKDPRGLCCIVEPVMPCQFADGVSRPNMSLERHFLWCLANAARTLARMDWGKDEKKRKNDGEEEKSSDRMLRELVALHGTLMRRGMHFGHADGELGPAPEKLLLDDLEVAMKTEKKSPWKELKFLEEFAATQPPSALAQFLCQHHPFVHLGHSQLHFGNSRGYFRVGKPIEIRFLARDQHRREVSPEGECSVVVVVVSSGSGEGGGEEAETEWGGQLKAQQKKTPYRPVPCGRALYQCVSAHPQFAYWSLEELRWAFAFSRPRTERIRLNRQNGHFSAIWTPQRAGAYSARCAVDGYPLAGPVPMLQVQDADGAQTGSPASSGSGQKPPADISHGQNLSIEKAMTRKEKSSAKVRIGGEESSGIVTPSIRRVYFPAASPFAALRIRLHPSLSAHQIGVVPRGSSLDFVEILRNDDGVWLRLGEETKRELVLSGTNRSQHLDAAEAWVLQLNAHLQTEFFQLAPRSNGNFLPPSASGPSSSGKPPPATTISILDSPKFRKSPRPPSSSSIYSTLPVAMGPAHFESLRWLFAAMAWHSSEETEGCTVEQLMEADEWMKMRIKKEENRKEWPRSVGVAMKSWGELMNEEALCMNKLGVGRMKETEEEAEEKEKRTEREEAGGVAIRCELCPPSRLIVGQQIGAHMRNAHPGCGAPCGSCGYNSAGQWTAGWSGHCGEGGEGTAVWYLLCSRCREKYLRKARITADGAGTLIAEGNLKRLKENAKFLLELNRPPVGGKNANGGKNAEEGRKKFFVPSGAPRLCSSDSSPAWPPPSASASSAHPPSHSFPSGAISPPPPAPPLIRALLAFCSVPHDLPALRALFRASFRRALALTFAFRLWAWLFKSASSQQCAQDVVWHFLSALHLSSSSSSSASSSSASLPPLLPHPAQLCLLAGPPATVPMVAAFHSLLHSLAVVLQQSSAEGVDPRTKCLCFRAWTFQLTDHEQCLLPTIRSLLSAIGTTLGGTSTVSDTDHTLTTDSAHSNNAGQHQKSRSKSSPNSESMPDGGKKDGRREKIQISHRQLEDLSMEAQLEATSRPQLLGCLVDGSGETFWESGEEDRGRERRIGVQFGAGGKVRLLGLFVDNARDEGYRVARVAIKGGEREDGAVQGGEQGEGEEPEQGEWMMDRPVDKSFSGWIKCGVVGHTRVQIFLWGDNLGCRIRLLCLLGHRHGPLDSPRHLLARSGSSQLGASTSTPSDSAAFVLFRSLATQVFAGDGFGDEADESGGAGGNGTLREQVLDMLCSRSQLQPLQQFIGTHLSNAMEREVRLLASRRKRNFSYATALLQLLGRMVSGAPSPFAPDWRLIKALADLSLFAPEAMQLQALEGMELMIARGKPPEGMDAAMLAEQMLVPVVKMAELQVKERGGGRGQQQHPPGAKHSAESHCGAAAPAFWALGRHASTRVAQMAIRVLRSLPDPWRPLLRAPLGHFVLRLSALVHDSLAKGLSLAESIRCPPFWLAVAALATMDGPEWLEELPGYQRLKQNQRDRVRGDPLCENHDDGRTRAQLRCQTCAVSLCRECFAVLHLSRRNQSHRARLVGSGFVAVPRADFHEGCHRLKLGTGQHQLLLLLISPRNLVGLVELGPDGAGLGAPDSSSSLAPSSSGSLSSIRKSSSQQEPMGRMIAPRARMESGPEEEEEEEAMDECREGEGPEQGEEQLARPAGETSRSKVPEEAKCRFCGAKLSTVQLFHGVCEFDECRQKDRLACRQIFACGHWCPGIRDEPRCPPCLRCDPSAHLRQDGDDLCAICFSERLGEAPCVQLRCGHFFHWLCVRTGLEKRWPGPRITFRFMQCALCKEQIDHPSFADLLAPLRELQRDVETKARMRLEYERGGAGGAGTSSTATETDEKVLLETALARYMYVQCARCRKAYFGGEASCQHELEEMGGAGAAEHDPEELVCGACAAEAGAPGASGSAVCGRHGTDFLEYKCRFCCSVAVYFCFGTTHFCVACHGDFPRLLRLPRHALPHCPVAPRGVQLPDSEPCPLHIAHPPTGQEYALGCGICRNLGTF